MIFIAFYKFSVTDSKMYRQAYFKALLDIYNLISRK